MKLDRDPANLSIRSHRIHYAWLIVGMAAALQVSTNFLSQAFAIVLVILQEEPFEFAVTLILIAYFLRSIIGAVLAPAAGWVADRYGVRRSLLAGAALYVAGMLLMSTMTQEWQLYLYYALVLGTAQALFSVNIPTTVATWFQTRLGLASGIQQSAGGMGASIMAPIVAILFSHVEWETAFLYVAAVGGAIIFFLVMGFHSEPAAKGMKPYGAPEGDPVPVPSTNSEVNKVRSQVFMQHVRRTGAFWNLIAIHHLGCVGHAIVMLSVVFFAKNQGVSLATASWIISIYTFCSIFTRFTTPLLADRWGAKGVMALAFFIQGITVALLFWTQEAWQFYLFAALFGIGFGGEMSAFIVINRQYYGMGPVRAVFGFQHMGAGLGMALGGLVGGVVYDVFGSYNIAWLISMGASFGGAACILMLESTSQPLIPNWEESLPPEARSSPPASRQPDVAILPDTAILEEG